MSNIGATIDALYTAREKKKALEDQVKQADAAIDAIEDDLIAQMDKEGIVQSKGTRATVSIGESVKPSVVDWDDFYKFIHRHKFYHLLERRPSVLACRELFETKGKIPGVVPFTQRKLNFRST